MYLYGALGILALIIIIVLILKKSKTPQENKTETPKPHTPQETLKVRVQDKPEAKPTKEETKITKPQEDTNINVSQDTKKEEVVLPECKYPKFDHARLIEMGLGEDDAKEFVADLIKQVESTLNDIQVAIDNQDMEKLEALTHSIKGSSTNIGVGGIADLLIEFNTYTKNSSDPRIVQEYFNNLKVYLQELKNQYK
jgi:HPt (histidine-containing phosphotransfer) domain-containing protein